MDLLKKRLDILKEIRRDLINHDRRYIGKVKRHDAIDAITAACLCVDGIIRYNEVRENEEAYNEDKCN